MRQRAAIYIASFWTGCEQKQPRRSPCFRYLRPSADAVLKVYEKWSRSVQYIRKTCCFKVFMY